MNNEPTTYQMMNNQEPTQPIRVIPYGIYKIGTTPLRFGSYSHIIISKDVYTTLFGRNALFEIVQEIFHLEHGYLEPSRKSANIEHRRFWANGMLNWNVDESIYVMGNAEHVQHIQSDIKWLILGEIIEWLLKNEGKSSILQKLITFCARLARQ